MKLQVVLSPVISHLISLNFVLLQLHGQYHAQSAFRNFGLYNLREIMACTFQDWAKHIPDGSFSEIIEVISL